MADTTVDLGDIRGAQGDPGLDGGRGSLWYTGTAITHTSGTDTPDTGISGALVGDMYLNTATSDVYRCTAAGDSGAAVWTFLLNIKGANGNGSLVTETQSDGYTKVTFTDAESTETAFVAGNTRASGETVLTGGLVGASGVDVHVNRVIARGDVCIVDLSVDGFSLPYEWGPTGSNVLGLIPTGYRPVASVKTPATFRFNDAGFFDMGEVFIGTDGAIRPLTRPYAVRLEATPAMNFVSVWATFMRA